MRRAGMLGGANASGLCAHSLQACVYNVWHVCHVWCVCACVHVHLCCVCDARITRITLSSETESGDARDVHVQPSPTPHTTLQHVQASKKGMRAHAVRRRGRVSLALAHSPETRALGMLQTQLQLQSSAARCPSATPPPLARPPARPPRPPCSQRSTSPEHHFRCLAPHPPPPSTHPIGLPCSSTTEPSGAAARSSIMPL